MSLRPRFRPCLGQTVTTWQIYWCTPNAYAPLCWPLLPSSFIGRNGQTWKDWGSSFLGFKCTATLAQVKESKTQFKHSFEFQSQACHKSQACCWLLLCATSRRCAAGGPRSQLQVWAPLPQHQQTAHFENLAKLAKPCKTKNLFVKPCETCICESFQT